MRLPGFRLSILGLMAVVLACGVCFAALRDASDAWGGAMLLGTAGLLGVALLGSKYGRGPDRAWWHGFALFGWGYLIATMAPWFDHQVGPKLPTSLALDYLQRLAVGPPQSATWSGNVTVTKPNSTITAEHLQITYQDGRTANVDASGPDASLALGPPARTALPGAINREAFLQAGHCSFALLVAVIGAIIGRHFRSAEELTAP